MTRCRVPLRVQNRVCEFRRVYESVDCVRSTAEYCIRLQKSVCVCQSPPECRLWLEFRLLEFRKVCVVHRRVCVRAPQSVCAECPRNFNSNSIPNSKLYHAPWSPTSDWDYSQLHYAGDGCTEGYRVRCDGIFGSTIGWLRVHTVWR